MTDVESPVQDGHGSTEELEQLLEHLKLTRGFDFTAYKRASLQRRIAKRMDEVGIDAYPEYIDHLEVHPDEFNELFDTILINVTGFFRDAAAWHFLAESVVPDLLSGLQPGEPLRVWSAGCATGEEAYSVAMLLADAVGDEAFRERVKIYATDADEHALAIARAAEYEEKLVADIPDALRDRFLESSNGLRTIRPDIRRSVIFGRNDLVQDAPISRIDLLVCRNTLMYFNAEAQGKILARFNFALKPGGALMVGKSEMLITHTSLFQPLDVKRRVFRAVAQRTLQDRLMGINHPVDGQPAAVPSDFLRDSVLDAVPMAQIVLDGGRRLTLANAAAREAFTLGHADLGRPLQDLTVSYRPLELRPLLDRADAEHRPVGVTGVVLPGPDAAQRFDVLVTPLVTDGELVATSISYTDVTRAHGLEAELESSRSDLETAYEELQSTIEELETTNEELQSTNEELETTNEELQSTNEELETMNEELHSTNEELESSNEEMRGRGEQLDEVNGFLEVILTSLGVAVVVLDRDLVVRIWNSYAEELWGLRRDEAEGRRLLSLDIGLATTVLERPVRAALTGEREKVEIEAVNRRGRTIQCRITSLPLRAGEAEPTGAILLMEQIAAS